MKRSIDPNADAFCRIIAAMLLEQSGPGKQDSPKANAKPARARKRR